MNGPLRSRANRGPWLALFVWLLLGAWQPFDAAGQELQVEKAQGTAEALVPRLGWRRAVLGRVLPSESVVTTWLDSTVTVSGNGLVLEVAPLTHVSIVSAAADKPSLALEAGSITVRSEKPVMVRIPARGVECEGQGTFALSTFRLAVTAGSVTVRRTGGAAPLLVAQGESASLVPRELAPVF